MKLTARTSLLVSTAAITAVTSLLACGGDTSDDTSQTQPGTTGGAAGSGGGTGGGTAGTGASAGTSAGAAGKGGSTAGAAGTGGSTAGSGGSTAGSGGSSAGAGGTTAGAGGTAGKGGGGAGGTGGTSGTGGGDVGGGGGSGGTSLVGSYELTLPMVVQSKMPLGQSSPTPGNKMRLDLQASGAGYEAVITSYYGTPSPMTVDVSATELTLTGMVVIDGTTNGNVTDTWTSFTLARTAQGGLSDAVKAMGDEEAFGGDVIDSATLDGTGTLAVDGTLPAVKLELSSVGGPKGKHLPWDDFGVRVSEPVTSAALAKALGLSAGGKTLAFTVTAATPTFAGAVVGSAYLTDWSVATGPLTVATQAGVIEDPTSNFAVAFSGDTAVVAVGPAQAAQDLDSDVQTVTGWGLTTFLGGKSGSDPHCEMGGCAKLGPIALGYCSMDEAGFAGRIMLTPTSKEIAVRFRIFADGASTTLPPVILSLVSHDGQTSVVTSSVMLAADATGELPFSTPWSTLTAPLPMGATGEIGFVVAAQAVDQCGFVPPGINGIVYVDRVDAQ